jgi:hypothetical protein
MVRKLLLVVVALVVVASPVAAGPLFSFNTGTDGNTNLIDDNWTVNDGPAYIPPLDPSGNWIPNTSTSSWISVFPDNNGGEGVFEYTYNFAFTLASGVDLSLIRLAGRWASDNQSRYRINTTWLTEYEDSCASSGPAVDDPGCYNSWHAFAITSGFQEGVNVLSFQVLNGGGPTGIRAEGAVATPEPGTLLLIGTGLSGLALRRRRKQA